MLSYHNTLIEPLMPSKIHSRFGDEIDTSVDLNGIKLDIPIISSPMDSINNPEFFVELRKLGGIGIIHRFMGIDAQINIWKAVNYKLRIYSNEALNEKIPDPPAIMAIGINGDWIKRFDLHYKDGVRHFLIDIANGFCEDIVKVIKTCREHDCWVMAGNVASAPGYKYLDKLGVNAVRVGIGTGSACTTRKMTGIGYPMLSALQGCNQEKNGTYTNFTKESFIIGGDCSAAIVADGGIKEPSDMVKALFCGADAVMMGYAFASCVESSPGLKLGSTRVYRGMASFAAQRDAGKAPRTAEGEEFPIKVDKTLEEIMSSYEGGLRSAMSYLNSNMVSEMKEGGNLITVPSNMREGY